MAQKMAKEDKKSANKMKKARAQTSVKKTKKLRHNSIIDYPLYDSSSGEFSLQNSDISFFESADRSMPHKIASDKKPKIQKLLDNDNFAQGDYILVNFGGKISLFYVGQIIEVKNDISFTVSFLRKSAETETFTEPYKKDVSIVLRSDIEAKLPKPLHLPGTSRSTTKFIFNLDFGGLKIR